MSVATRPMPTAPDSPETTCGSPFTGAPSILMPFAATQSGQETKKLVWFFSMSKPIVFGSPQARPAMIVCRSPVANLMLPSPAAALLYRQSATWASMTTVVGQLSGYRFAK